MRHAKFCAEPRVRTRKFASLRISARAGNRMQGWLAAGPHRLPVALGRGGIRANKREGDGATPRGTFRPLRLWWRADRGPPPASGLPLARIRREDAWCEDPADRRYNRPLRGTAAGGADRLWRDDALYDLVVEIDHNARPRVARRGSAVFVHVARAGLAPTAGCVALHKNRLRWLLRYIGRRTRIVIQ
ncbi:MAG: L,D-transpeptidase family protein [Proteobacteria bacterium]|nr:L,D-transpeptidase family protein [Pseudomonadota bacterium]